MSTTVAQTILKQLGGGRFALMTGAKGFTSTGNGVFFRIGRNHRSINKVSVDLMGDDTYTMKFCRVRKSVATVAKEVKGLYFDQLQEVFTRETGMYTHL